MRAILWRFPTNSASHSGGSKAQILHACARSSAHHAGFRIQRVTENMRLSSLRNDQNATERALQFPNYLLHRGEGRLETAEDGMVELPESVQRVLDIDTLCSTVFDGLESNYCDVSWLTFKSYSEDYLYWKTEFNSRKGFGHASSQFVTSERGM